MDTMSLVLPIAVAVVYVAATTIFVLEKSPLDVLRRMFPARSSIERRLSDLEDQVANLHRLLKESLRREHDLEDQVRHLNANVETTPRPRFSGKPII